MRIKTSLNLEKTLYCGQFFRVQKIEDAFMVYFGPHRLLARQVPNGIDLSTDLAKEEVVGFFDLERDYEKIQKVLARDPLLRDPLKEAEGIHILGQDPWEVLLSFILSQNSNITRIRTNLFSLCQSYGPKIRDQWGTYWGFPRPQDLAKVTRADYREKIRVGYRDKYLEGSVAKVLNNPSFLENIGAMPSSRDKLKALEEFSGVGEKVAHCILLFGYQDFSAFPIDVWMKRILLSHYKVQAKKDYYTLGQDLFFPYPGYAQQALFYYSKNHKIGG